MDLWRTNSYLGCFLSQSLISLAAIATNCAYTSHLRNLYLLIHLKLLRLASAIAIASMVQGYNNSSTVFIPAITSLSCSLLLLIIDSRSLLWTANTKDVLLGLVAASDSPKLSWRGFTRNPPLPNIITPIPAAIKKFLTTLLFRRIRYVSPWRGSTLYALLILWFSPAETPRYALVRNAFAVASVVVLIWQAATTLLRAQSKFETRVISRECPPLGNMTDIQIILVCLVFICHWRID